MNAAAPTRPCSVCGSRTGWRQRHDLLGGWQCCQPDDADRAWRVRRHDCTALGCGEIRVDDDDEDEDEAVSV